MIFALLPVKAPANAKQRLAGLLAPAERETLARAMFEHVFEVLCAARGIDRIVVATTDPATARHARSSGALVFEEQEQLSHSHSADAAAREARNLGATTVLMLPIDVPMVTAGEIEDLVDSPPPGVIIVPSVDGSGTNALVRTPPDVIESRFGRNSFEAHFRQAQARGVPVEVRRPSGLTFDIDTPNDVATLLARAPSSPIGRFLHSVGRCLSRSQP